MRIGVSIPFYNEEKAITATLEALLHQTDRDFEVFLCDNNSTDGSVALIESFKKKHGLSWTIIPEKQKGTGAASDTAMRAAAAAGNDILARTDADSIPASNWIEVIRQSFADEKISMIAGLSLPIHEETNAVEYWVYRFAIGLSTIFGVFRPSNYERGMKGIYVMTAGNNLAIRRDAYFAAGGFPRTKIEEAHEDRVLVNEVRRCGLKVRKVRKMLVRVSARRVKAWGVIGSLKWYRTHERATENVDIR